MNNAQQIIKSGILERFVLGLTDKDENRQIQKFAKTHPEVRKQITAIRAAMNRLTDQYNIPPPPKRHSANEKKDKKTSWLDRLFSK